MAATSIILCLLLRGRSRNQISTFFCQWLSEVWNKVPAAIRIGQFICLRVKAPSSAWEAPRLKLPICYRAGPGHLILHPAFESRSRGISWRVLGRCMEKKGEYSPVHGRHPEADHIWSPGAQLSVPFVVKLCAPYSSSFPLFIL